ncbi:hypothetical protein ABTN02_19950, partial [Acinetobacter baumannii]
MAERPVFDAVPRRVVQSHKHADSAGAEHELPRSAIRAVADSAEQLPAVRAIGREAGVLARGRST